MRALALFAALTPLLAQADRPMIRAHFTPAGPVLVSQPVRLTVSVLVPTFFSNEPGFPALQIPGAMTVAAEGQAGHLNETINGKPYFGISRDYLIYPQAPGEFTLPPVEIPVEYSAGGIKTTQARLTLPPVKFSATIPEQAEGLGYFIATSELTVTHQVDKKLVDLRVGDTFHRTITVRAPNTFAMLLPPLDFEAPDGIRVYPAQPTVDDLRTVRGEFVAGQRVDSAAFLVQKEGHYRLPEIAISWWNVKTGQMRTTRIPAVEFDALPNPGYRPELTPYAQPELSPPVDVRSSWSRYKRWAKLGLIALVCLVVGWWAWRRYGTRVLAAVEHRRWERQHSAAAQLRRVCMAARHNDAPATERELLRLRHVVPPGSVSAPLALRAEIDELERSLYSPAGAGSWNGKPLERPLSSAAAANRKVMRQIRGKPAAIPPLNPLS